MLRKNKKRHTNLSPETDLGKQQKCIKIKAKAEQQWLGTSWAHGAVGIHRGPPPLPRALLFPSSPVVSEEDELSRRYSKSPVTPAAFPWASLVNKSPRGGSVESQWRAFEKETPLYLPSSERFKGC